MQRRLLEIFDAIERGVTQSPLSAISRNLGMPALVRQSICGNRDCRTDDQRRQREQYETTGASFGAMLMGAETFRQRVGWGSSVGAGQRWHLAPGEGGWGSRVSGSGASMDSLHKRRLEMRAATTNFPRRQNYFDLLRPPRPAVRTIARVSRIVVAL